MSKITLFGGNSELGLATAQKIIESNPEFSKIVRVSRSHDSEVYWNPLTVELAKVVLDSLSFEKNDICIISLGHLGDIGSFGAIDGFSFEKEIELSLWINAILPLQIFFSAFSKLKLAGGGSIVIFSSVAAHPVLPNNSIYGRSKNLLEGVISDFLELNGKDAENHVTVSFVLPAFVPTPLNSGRKPTLFATTTESVANSVANNLGQRFIWVPRIFRIIEIFLGFRPFRRIASSLILKSVKH